MGGEPGKWLSTEGTKLMMFLLANFQGHLCMLMVHVGMFMLHFFNPCHAQPISSICVPRKCFVHVGAVHAALGYGNPLSAT